MNAPQSTPPAVVQDHDPLSSEQRSAMQSALARTEPATGEDVRRALSDAQSVGGHNHQPLIQERLHRVEARVPAIVRRLLDAEAEVDRLRAELAKYVGHEPTLAEEALYVHEQQVRRQVAQEVNRARKPIFAASENPELVVKTTRAIDIRLIELGADAPYWVPESDGGAA